MDHLRNLAVDHCKKDKGGVSLKVCHFGAYDHNYPRNQIIRQGLILNDVQVIECNVSQEIRTWQKYPLLFREYLRSCQDCDCIVVPEFGQSLVPLAWLLSKLTRKPLIFDAFTSLYDSAVSDRKIVKAESIRALHYYFLDKLALSLADTILVDTKQHAEYFIKQFSVKSPRINVIPVGVNDDWFYPRQANGRKDNYLLIQFYGTFIPLHGVQYIVKAAKILEKYPDIKIELIGRGQTFEDVYALAQQLGLRSLSFIEPVPPIELPLVIARADICLGIFGDTGKAHRVIPNKVYQSLAMRKPVITGDSPAIREVFRDGEHLLLCRMADPESLAEAILQLKNSEALRERIALNSYALVTSQFTPEAIGKRLKGVLEELLER